jgi:glycosyltransferase involved in cell wall biosynthesis
MMGLSWKYKYWYLRNSLGIRRSAFLLKMMRIKLGNHQQNENPLISILIPTYNRGKVLSERTIPSILKQTYQNFEIVIVGDHCVDDTGERLKKICDNRIRFYNLPQRGKYPLDPEKRWFVAGVVPINVGLKLVRGDWIANLDDDDEFSPNHLEILLKYALKYQLEMVYGVVQSEEESGKWKNIGAYPIDCGNICRLSSFYRSSLRFFKCDINAWKIGEPADWNLWRRMKEAGVKIGFVDEIVGKHYLEKQQYGK